MARGAISSEGSGGEGVQHFSTVRFRMTGQGILRIAISSLDYKITKVLAPVVLEQQPRIQPNRIINFVQQRACFDITTSNINDYFRINRIVVYMKEIYTSYPGA